MIWQTYQKFLADPQGAIKIPVSWVKLHNNAPFPLHVHMAEIETWRW